MKLLGVVCFIFCLLAGTGLAADLTEAQKLYIDQELAERGLNTYGDLEGTVYAGGTPLFDETTGQMTDRYDHVIRKHPDILDGFVGVQPVALVSPIVDSSRRLRNDFDARRMADRDLEALVAHETVVQQLIDAIRVAVEARDYRAIGDLLLKVAALPDGQLGAFAPVLRETRQMLQMPTIQPVETTAQVAELLRLVSELERRIR